MKELGERKLGVQKQAVSYRFLEPGENSIVNSFAVSLSHAGSFLLLTSGTFSLPTPLYLSLIHI